MPVRSSKAESDIHAVIGAVGDVQAVIVDVQGDVVVGKTGPVVVAGDGDVLVDFDLVSSQREVRR